MSLPRPVLPNTTYLVTRRCLGRRFLLRPDAALNQLFLYCLALGAQKYGIAVHGLSVMSNHYHLTLTDERGVLPDFMGWLNSQLAKRIKRLREPGERRTGAPARGVAGRGEHPQDAPAGHRTGAAAEGGVQGQRPAVVDPVVGAASLLPGQEPVSQRAPGVGG